MNVYSIRFTKQADKAIRRIPRYEAKLIRDKLEQIAADPYARRSDVTRLRNRPGYRLRVGKWRVICEIRNDEVLILVLKIATRGEIYK
jgi:mRNA interferase RelE/StbE